MVAMSQKPQKLRVSKPTVHKTDRKKCDLGKHVAATCSIKITHNSVTSAAKQVGIPLSTLSRIRKNAVEHAKENNLPLTDLSNYKDKPRSGKSPALSVDEGDQLCSIMIST